MTAPLLIVLSLTLAAVIANFAAVLFALRESRRGQQAASEGVHAALGTVIASAQQMLDATLEETRASNELTRCSNELVQESNELTRRNLEVIERALDFSKRSFEVAHQPSLHVVKVETLSGSSSVDTMLAARVSLRNTGTSDAHDVTISGHFHAGPVNIDELEFPEAGGQGQGFVGPDIVTHGTIQQSLTFELRDANARSGRLYLVCCVRYGDDFGALHLAVFTRVWSGGQWVAVREKRKRVAA